MHVQCISPCHKAHKALTIPFHSLQFTARALAVAHDCHQAAHLLLGFLLVLTQIHHPAIMGPCHFTMLSEF